MGIINKIGKNVRLKMIYRDKTVRSGDFAAGDPDTSEPMRGIRIDDTGWKITNLNKEGFRKTIDADSLDLFMVKVCGRQFGCMCDHDGYAKNMPISALCKKILGPKDAECIVLSHGPIFIYLNKGLTDEDIDLIGSRIVVGKWNMALFTEECDNRTYTAFDP